METRAGTPLLRMVFFLADLGVVVWFWSLYQMREVKYDLVGFALACAPANSARAYAGGPPPRAAPKLEGPERNFIRDPELRMAGSPERKASNRSPAAAGGAARPETRRLVASAARAYFDLKKSARFRDSAQLRAWEADFKSFPDLRSADEQYRRDHDGVGFLVSVSRSPNFRLMLGKYLGAADIQAFLREVCAQPALSEALRSFLKDFNLEAAASHLWPSAGAPQGRS